MRPTARHPICAAFVLCAVSYAPAAAQRPISHPPLRTAPSPAKRAIEAGPAYFVDARRGDDKAAGTTDQPWRTVGHAVKQLHAGHTLYLRGGTYYERLYIALAGAEKSPITIRSYPGEQAVLDGGLAEFRDSPETAWEPFSGGAAGEYRSKARYPNLRDVAGSFGDSMIGLQTYYHAIDLRADSEFVDWQDWKRRETTDIKPLYCGPGMWYDRATGHIHIRLAHTHLPEPVPNYRGPTDPRQLPLIVVPFAAVPLHVDGGAHLRFQDLVIRGGGYHTILLDHATDVEFDNVTVWCGTYGIHASRTVDFRFLRSALYGNVAPWTFRGDGSKRDYPGRPHRNISRLNTHALLDIESGLESSVYATPQNDRWELAYSEFTDAHDGVYLGAINCRFHHNLIENLQDDGIYLSPMYHRHRLDKTDPEIHIYQNVFRGLLTALALGGTETVTRDRVYVYRNIFDLRSPVQTGRPSTQEAKPSFSSGKLIGDHGSPPWPAMFVYHNTIVAAEPARDAAMASLAGTGNPRRVFNNIFYHFASLPGYVPPDAVKDAAGDGNLYWSPMAKPVQAKTLFDRYRASEAFANSKKLHAPGSDANSRVADPKFARVSAIVQGANDYRLDAASPAIDAGAEVPAAWPDPLRVVDRGRPDVGAIPSGSNPLEVGRGSRP